MNNKLRKLIYWGSTSLLSLMMAASAIGGYFFNTEMVKGVFENLGYPSYLIIPLGIVKLLGISALILNQLKRFREWAYAGFFYDFTLATIAHIAVNDGEWIGAVVSIFLLIVSRLTLNARYI